MDWTAILCVVFMNFMNIQAYHGVNINKIIDIIKRRNFMRPSPRNYILGAPQYPEDLPEAEPILPGHTLLRPARGMLKSAVKYPLRDFGGAAVYGNLDNLGITYGRTNQRILYSDFRKSNNLLAALNKVLKNYKTERNEKIRPMVVLEIDPSKLIMNQGDFVNLAQSQISDEENNAKEDIQDLVDEENSNEVFDFRRKKTKSRHRNRNIAYAKDGAINKKNKALSDVSSDDSSSSLDVEKNPGNPYTIHKNKYKQNWLWNHNMDGDHMNINPYAPSLNSLGPSGSDLFFGRKWWYFNQDDYKPMR